jgi:hypothetical protein
VASPDPFNNAQAWDQIQIGGMVWGGPAGLFGKIRIQGASRFYKIDAKKGKGLNGATQTYQGQHPKKFKLIFSWWTPSQHDYWTRFQLLFLFDATKLGSLPPVWPIYHPALQLLGITAICVEDVGAVEVDEVTKLASASLTVEQFVPPPPLNATTTPKAVPPNTPPPTLGSRAPTASEAAVIAQINQTKAAIAASNANAIPHPPVLSGPI